MDGQMLPVCRRDDVLTCENTLFSQVKNDVVSAHHHHSCGVQLIAQSGERLFPDQPLSSDAADLLRHSLAPSSQRIYCADLRHFREWGGVFPASPAMICAYIADHAATLAVATIQRRVFTLSKAHARLSLPRLIAWKIVESPPIWVSERYSRRERSPPSGRSILITRAPMSASRSEQ